MLQYVQHTRGRPRAWCICTQLNVATRVSAEEGCVNVQFLDGILDLSVEVRRRNKGGIH